MDFIRELSPQVATLVVLYLVVRAFLQQDKESKILIKQLNVENLTARDQSRIVIEKNTAVVAENTEVTRAVVKALKEVSDYYTPIQHRHKT